MQEVKKSKEELEQDVMDIQIQTEQENGIAALVHEVLSKGLDPAEVIVLQRIGSAAKGQKVGTIGEVRGKGGKPLRWFTMVHIEGVARTIWIISDPTHRYAGYLSGGSAPVTSADTPYSVAQHIIDTDHTLTASEMMLAVQIATIAYENEDDEE